MTRWWHFLLAVAVGLVVVATAVAGLSAALVYPNLPSLDSLTDYRPKQPLRIFTEDGALIGEFGEERRAVVRLKDTPKALRQAILAAEDERFYQHGGVDTIGVLRAALANVVSGGAKEGASTITMQVARNFFLTSEKTLRRKLNEALLAIKIEHALSKDDILELYLNHIYLGQRAYGFAAAAQIYYGKPLAKINLAEAAMLAGLPKAPSAYNPVVNPTRAKSRQLYVLGRMKTLGYISADEYTRAREQRLPVKYSPQNFEAEAPHLAELVRQRMHQKYGDAIYISGMKVYTTLRLSDQRAALAGVRQGVVEFNRRRGYAGPEAQLKLPAEETAAEKMIEGDLLDREESNGFLPGVVLSVDKTRIRARMRSGDTIDLGPSELKYAARFLSAKQAADKRLARGSVIRVVRLSPEAPWQLTYLPQVEAAFVSLSPDTGAIRSLVGGFAFARSQFNHVTQAWRQPGSSFKPFIYSAALERGVTPANVFDDLPLTVDPAETGGVAWEPKNYDGTTGEALTLRGALAKSKNLVSIRVLQAAGAQFGHEHAAKFGFDMNRIPPYLTMALGAGEVTPLSLAAGYAVFANGGGRVVPWHLLKVTDKDGHTLENFAPVAPIPVLDPRNAFIMTSMLRDVVRHGTAASALRLGRGDLAGKTGTTNDSRDAWFAGFQRTRVAVAWMGYDQPRSLGSGETGGGTALPIWIRYMGEVLKGVEEMPFSPPAGIVVVNVDPKTGLTTPEGQGVPEYFFQEYAPGATEPETHEDPFGDAPMPAQPAQAPLIQAPAPPPARAPAATPAQARPVPVSPTPATPKN
ncbi:MAG: penicillin-binding protein 1A [Pseudomonadota bacterium]|nr:penicillin-binding protein 1A [Pseudomonadota bacterium]MDP1904286.1 penicillin-binding protein 1A [Pseudomonadota bacterium]MDP2351852.1 penicillin-binding protein 1A [Pseudomonadota bacterium]